MQRRVCNDQWVLNAIQGYQIDWTSHQHQPACHHFSKDETESLESEIQTMLEKGAISPVENHRDGFLSTIFIVPKKDGGHRPIINLKRVNQFIPHHHFKMEGIHMLKDLLRQGDFMAKIDLKDAYFAVQISEPDRKYLRFRWRDTVYQFNCLPFGLSCAPWVFTKITKAATAVLRERSIRLIIYIDDILIMAESETLLQDHVAATVYLLENLGFIINYPKSILEPRTTLEFLGFQVDSSSMELKLPGNKLKNIRGKARRILASSHTSALELSRVLGKMNAATRAISVAPLFYRHLQAQLQSVLNCSNQNYNTRILLSEDAREELQWWTTHFTSAVAYINKMGGTVSPALNKLNKEFWLWCMERDISVQAQHLAGKLNCTADEESRVMKDRSDWMLCPSVFRQINRILGPLEVDLFALRLSAQLPTYVSWKPDPETLATDAFTVNWKTWKAYANPPWSLVGRVLAQAQQQKADLVLVTPIWRTQTWYPTILKMCRDFPRVIPPGFNLIQPTHPLAMPDVTPQLAVWSISGDDTKSTTFRRKLQNTCSLRGEKSHRSHMTLNSRSGLAGAVQGVSIPFLALWET